MTTDSGRQEPRRTAIEGDAVSVIAQTEKQFSDAVVEYARLCGWLIHRDPYWRPTATDPGFPDLCMAREGVVVFAELKVGKGKRTRTQCDWATAIYPVEASPIKYRLWTPADWPDIESVLR